MILRLAAGTVLLEIAFLFEEEEEEVLEDLTRLLLVFVELGDFLLGFLGI